MRGSEKLKQEGLTRRQFLSACALAASAAALPISLSGCKSAAGDAVFKGEHTITDDAGREIVVPTPDRLEKIFSTSGLAQLYLITLAPDLLGAASGTYTQEELRFLPKAYVEKDLTSLGATESGSLDVESLMVHGIQLVFSISSVALTQANIDEAINIQDRSGVPVVLIDGSSDRIGKAYELIGSIIGREERAKELAAYCENAYNEVTAAVADIPEDERVKVYYAEGPLGIQTEPAESQHAEAMVVAGANLVAKVDNFNAVGMADVSMESVVAWDPEVIIAWDEELRGGADNRIRTHDDWSVIKAVKDGRVYTMPNTPFAWLDRPTACNRFLGMKWMANLLYPDRYDIDMLEEGKKFYKLFLDVDVSDEDMRKILGNSYTA